MNKRFNNSNKKEEINPGKGHFMPKITLKLFENLPLIKHGAMTDSDGDSVPTGPLKSE